MAKDAGRTDSYRSEVGSIGQPVERREGEMEFIFYYRATKF